MIRVFLMLMIFCVAGCQTVDKSHHHYWLSGFSVDDYDDGIKTAPLSSDVLKYDQAQYHYWTRGQENLDQTFGFTCIVEKSGPMTLVADWSTQNSIAPFFQTPAIVELKFEDGSTQQYKSHSVSTMEGHIPLTDKQLKTMIAAFKNSNYVRVTVVVNHVSEVYTISTLQFNNRDSILSCGTLSGGQS